MGLSPVPAFARQGVASGPDAGLPIRTELVLDVRRWMGAVCP
jgi:hypothetical protein